MLKNLKLPQNLTELSNITDEDLLVENWSGAVVFLVVEDHLVLIKRSKSMPTHKDQIAFMGGHKKEDELDPFITAMREFNEESSITTDLIECLGLIHPVLTTKQKLIIPVFAKFLGSMDDFVSQVKSNGEWDDLVLTPLRFLADANNWSAGQIIGRRTYSVYFAPLMHDHCVYMSEQRERPYILWGASAKMILNFFQKHLDSDKSSH